MVTIDESLANQKSDYRDFFNGFGSYPMHVRSQDD